MSDIQNSGRLALKTICEDIYSHHRLCLDIGPIKDLLIKYKIDPEHLIDVTLMYRESVDAATKVDSTDVLYWLRTEINKYSHKKAETQSADEEDES